jgi:hypothetical protein
MLFRWNITIIYNAVIMINHWKHYTKRVEKQFGGAKLRHVMLHAFAIILTLVGLLQIR